MSNSSVNSDRVLELAAAVCDGVASQRDLVALDAILHADESSRRRYLKHCQLHAALELETHSRLALNRLCVADPRNPTTLMPWESEALLSATLSEELAPANPIARYFPNVIHGMIGEFASDWSVAYLLATVICGVGLVVGALIHVSQPQQTAGKASTLSSSVAESRDAAVGRITAMVDCRSSDKTCVVSVNDTVPLGQQIALTAGLLQITYNTGAKVVLQGPVRYLVDSPNGGFLPIGRLMGSVMTLDGRGFAVRTPVATVVDLGTEFGIEVKESGQADIHVFSGLVEARPVSGQVAQRTRQLRQGEAITMQPGREPVRIDCNRGAFLDPAAMLHASPMKARYPHATVTETDMGSTADAFLGKLQADDDLQRAFEAGTATINLVSGPASPRPFSDVARLCDAQNARIFHGTKDGGRWGANHPDHMFVAPADGQFLPAIHDIEFGSRYVGSRELREINIFHGANENRSPYSFEVLYSTRAHPRVFRPLAKAENLATQNATWIRIASQSGDVDDVAVVRVLIRPTEIADGNWVGNSFAEIDMNFYPKEKAPQPIHVNSP